MRPVRIKESSRSDVEMEVNRFEVRGEGSEPRPKKRRRSAILHSEESDEEIRVPELRKQLARRVTTAIAEEVSVAVCREVRHILELDVRLRVDRV